MTVLQAFGSPTQKRACEHDYRPHAALVWRQKQAGAVQVKKWKMEAEDTTLLDLIPFLEAVCSARQVDVRDVVHSYQGQDIPTAFRYASLPPLHCIPRCSV